MIAWAGWVALGWAADSVVPSVAPSTTASTTASMTPTIEMAAGKGFTVTSADQRFAVNLRARMQLRESLDVVGGEPTISTQLATARLWVAGHVLSQRLGYNLQFAFAQRDYRDGATSPVYDAWLELAAHRDVTVRIGQFFVPFDRLRTIREQALQFPDRPRAISELNLDRDIGVVAWSSHLGGDRSPVGYRVGIFGGAGTNQLTAHPPGGLATARLELRPLGPIDDDLEGDLTRHERPGLAIGLAAAYNRRTARARSTTSTVFASGDVDYLHLAADGVFKWRGVAVEAEALTRRAVRDPASQARSGWGVITQASVMVSSRTELATRYARLAAMSGTDPNLVDDAASHAHEVGGGVNVYLNGHAFKIQNSVVGFVDTSGRFTEWNLRTMVDATL